MTKTPETHSNFELRFALGLICVVSAFLRSSEGGKGLVKSAATRLILVASRHGNRNPERFLVKNRQWGHEGEMMLNQFGVAESRTLGKELARFLGRRPQTINWISSSATRCIDTLKSIQHGIGDEAGQITINDPMLRFYSLADCPRNKLVWKPIIEDTLPELEKLKHSKINLLQYIASNSEFSPIVSHGADCADNIHQMDLYHVEYPTWLLQPKMEGYTKESIKKDIMSFAEIHQRTCASNLNCRDLMAGHWAHHLRRELISAAEEIFYSEDPRLVIYASHTEIVLSMMNVLNINRKEISTASGFILESKKEWNQEAKVRLLEHRPHSNDEHLIVLADLSPCMSSVQDTEGFLPLSLIIGQLDTVAVADWRSECMRA